jgi:glycosyltransferase involved in cell wall biosynthesis
MKESADFSLVQTGMHFDSSRGGADRYFAELLRGLGDYGVHCRAAAFGTPPGDSPHRLTSLAADDASLPSRLMALRRYGRENLCSASPTVFAWHFALYGGAALPWRARCETVAHFHGPWGDESAAEGASWPVVALKRWIERQVLRRANRIIVLSEAFRQLLEKNFGIARTRIHVVPPSIDLERFYPVPKSDARRKLGWPENGPLIFCLRRMVHRMGIEELIEAWSRVSVQHPDATLVLAGSGPQLPQLEALASRLMGQNGSIVFTGRLPEEMLPHAYSAADISIVPSRSLEGFGLVALESLACGTPAIVTPVGGLPEVVSGLHPGLVLPSTAVESLADGLLRALSGEIVLPDVTACRKYCAENFSSARMTSRVLEVYQQSLAGRKSK